MLSITRSDDIHDLRLSREWDDKATLTCEFDKGDDITVYWIVDDECYECTTSPDDIEPEINGCFTEKGFSVFYLRNLTSFDEGKLSVKCVTQQGIVPVLKNKDTLNENLRTRDRQQDQGSCKSIVNCNNIFCIVILL